MPTGVPLLYHLTGDLKVKDSRYLGDAAAVAAKMQAVADQGKQKK